MAPIASSAAPPPPPDNSGTGSATLEFDVVQQPPPPQEEEGEEQEHQRQMKMRAVDASSDSSATSGSGATSSESSENSASPSYTPSSSSTSAFAAAAVSDFSLSASELLASMSPLSATNDAPLNVFMESYKSRFQQQQGQDDASLSLTHPPLLVQGVETKVESPQTPTATSVSPKRERERETTGDDASSSQQEEDSSDSSTTKKVFKCPFPGCGKEFQLKGNLKRHQNIHNGDKKFRCKFCGKDFLRKADMEVHHRVHTGEKPYKCKFTDCDKCFARRSDLLSHERTHVGTKPFACLYPDCGRHFARKFDLQKHQRMHDNHSSECLQKRRKISSPSSGDDCNCWAAPTPMDVSMDAKRDVTQASQPAPAAFASAAAALAAQSAAAPQCRPQPQLTCTQNHIHSPPACFAAFTPDLLDTFLLSSREVFDTKPYPSCCGFGSVGGGIAAPAGHLHHHAHHMQASIKQQLEALVIGDELPATATTVSQTAAGSIPAAAGSSAGLPAQPAKRVRSASVSSTSSSTSCPIDAELLKGYAKHTPSCGHLSIVHGNHRDYVVKNHLVCQDNVRSIGGGENHALKPAKCPADEPHRPGCGHLPVRHRDHIDYVVEDNLFCQQAGMLDAGGDTIELLDDDFWEFYGAIGSLNTD